MFTEHLLDARGTAQAEDDCAQGPRVVGGGAACACRENRGSPQENGVLSIAELANWTVQGRCLKHSVEVATRAEMGDVRDGRLAANDNLKSLQVADAPRRPSCRGSWPLGGKCSSREY